MRFSRTYSLRISTRRSFKLNFYENSSLIDSLISAVYRTRTKLDCQRIYKIWQTVLPMASIGADD